MRSKLRACLLCGCFALARLSGQVAAGNSSDTNAAPQGSQSDTGKSSASSKKRPDLTAPRSDDGESQSISEQVGESSSSKDTKIDLTPPPNDEKLHPDSANAVAEAEAASNSGESVGEFHPWDPHKAAKDVEVGDYYFKRGNYRGAESRYREALFYKDNDAIATLRLAECLEKMGRIEEAEERYKGYLKILPHGPQAEEAQHGLERVQQAQKQSDQRK